MQAKLAEILKHKGIGPQGSKHLKEQDLAELQDALLAPEVSLTTKATLLTAFYMLPQNEVEKVWWDALLETPEAFIPQELIAWWKTQTGDTSWAKLIRYEDLSKEEAFAVGCMILDPAVPEFERGAILEAFRLKRETLEENVGFLKALQSKSLQCEVPQEIIIDLCDTYDGLNRSPILTPFVACLLASVGYPVVFHGTKSLGPKFGKTIHQLLELAGKSTMHTLEEAKGQLQNIGCTYVDQAMYFPELHALNTLREEMVKRPMLATWEKLLQPIRSKKGNHIVVGYTHTAYQSMISNTLCAYEKHSKVIVWRGSEGAARPPLNRKSLWTLSDTEQKSSELYPPEGLEDWAEKGFSLAKSLEIGLEALENKPGKGREAVLYWAESILNLFSLEKNPKKLLEGSLLSGKALNVWNDLP